MKTVRELPKVQELVFVFVLHGTNKLVAQRVRPSGLDKDGDVWVWKSDTDSLFRESIVVGDMVDHSKHKGLLMIMEKGNEGHISSLRVFARKQGFKMWYERR